MKRFLLYAIRWQLSSPILALCWYWLECLGVARATIVANLIGGCVFFWVDKWIFRKKEKTFKCEVKETKCKPFDVYEMLSENKKNELAYYYEPLSTHFKFHTKKKKKRKE